MRFLLPRNVVRLALLTTTATTACFIIRERTVETLDPGEPASVYMLARPGAHSLDWLATDMSKILSVAKFGRWYAGNMGLRIQVLRNGQYRQVARLADFGPIAWRHIAVMVPADGADSVRIRLEFTADQWRIDHVSIAAETRRARGRTVPLARIRTTTDETVQDALTQVADADGGYLTTQPSQRFFAEFETGVSTEPRTFLLAAHGYYTEWVRGDWLKQATETQAFDPGRVYVGDLLRDWRAAKDSLEAAFYSTRVPVL